MPAFVFPVLGLTEGASLGLGYREFDRYPSPAAGAAFSLKLDAAYDYRILSARATYTTDATVANRYPVLSVVSQDGTVLFAIAASTAVAASSAITYQWLSGIGYSSVGDLVNAVLPLADFLISGAYTVSLSATAIDAGDQISGVSLYVEKYPRGPEGYPTGLNIARWQAGQS